MRTSGVEIVVRFVHAKVEYFDQCIATRTGEKPVIGKWVYAVCEVGVCGIYIGCFIGMRRANIMKSSSNSVSDNVSDFRQSVDNLPNGSITPSCEEYIAWVPGESVGI